MKTVFVDLGGGLGKPAILAWEANKFDYVFSNNVIEGSINYWYRDGNYWDIKYKKRLGKSWSLTEHLSSAFSVGLLTTLIFFISKLLLNPYEKYKLNYNDGDTLKLDIKEKWGIEEFDAVIGNPPYQESNIDGRKALNHNLWSDFINYSYDLLLKDGLLLFITPNSWMSPTSKNNKVFYENYIIYLNISECEKWFNVGSKFSYYLIQKTNIKKETIIRCLYNKKIYNSKILIDNYKCCHFSRYKKRKL
jgi:hypothetical protein